MALPSHSKTKALPVPPVSVIFRAMISLLDESNNVRASMVCRFFAQKEKRYMPLLATFRVFENTTYCAPVLANVSEIAVFVCKDKTGGMFRFIMQNSPQN